MAEGVPRIVAARITAKERFYRDATGRAWERHDYTDAIRFRGLADGLDEARDILLQVIAESGAAGVSTPLDGMETARSAPEQQAPPRAQSLLADAHLVPHELSVDA